MDAASDREREREFSCKEKKREEEIA